MIETFIVTTSLFINTYTPPWAYITLCLVIGAILIYYRKVYEAVVFSIGFILTSGLVLTLKQIFAVPRPSNALIEFNGYAFPSNHSALAVFLAINIIWVVSRANKFTKRYQLILGLFLLLLALVVGASRVIIHAHTPLQVLVGFMIGIIVPLSLIYLGKKLK